MILFHEGLPRSGKTYEAVYSKILPWLKEGRVVQTNIYGINHQKISQYLSIDLDIINSKLFTITKEQAQQINKYYIKNAAIVIDEAASIYGVKTSISSEVQDFFKEHGHLGIDLLLIDQDVRDINIIARRRVDFKTYFTKLDFISLSGRYKAVTSKHLGSDKYEKLNHQILKYDPAIYELYSSHVDNSVIPLQYTDNRTSLFKSSFFRFWIPLSFIVICGVILLLNYLYKKTVDPKNNQSQPIQYHSPDKPKQVINPLNIPTNTPSSNQSSFKIKSPNEVGSDYFEKLSTDYRIRLSGYIKTKDRAFGVIEWYQNDTLIHRMDLKQLKSLGVNYILGDDNIYFQTSTYTVVATMWPLTDTQVYSTAQSTTEPQQQYQRQIYTIESRKNEGKTPFGQSK